MLDRPRAPSPVGGDAGAADREARQAAGDQSGGACAVWHGVLEMFGQVQLCDGLADRVAAGDGVFGGVDHVIQWAFLAWEFHTWFSGQFASRVARPIAS